MNSRQKQPQPHRGGVSRTGAARLAALLLVSTLSLLSGCDSAAPEQYNVLLVTLDTTRADRIGVYGDSTAHTPVLDGLAREGVLFQNAASVAPITAPSHASIITGKYPMAHGFRDNGLYTLTENQQTLAEMLQDAGYATAAAIGAYPLLSRFGFDQGFQVYDDDITAPLEDHLGNAPSKQRMFFDERRAAQVNDAILPWLKSRDDTPFFLWLHYFDPHQPFEPPPPFDQLYAHDLYAGEIAYTDTSLGFVLQRLEDAGKLDNTLVVVLADHGEGLGDHNEQTHAMLAYESTLRVPLLIRLPPAERGRGSVIEQRVGTVDIVPTILDVLGIESDVEFQGRSLRPLWTNGESDSGTRRYYAENLSPRLTHGWGELRVLYEDSLKYIHGPRPELYDLGSDPAERNNLIAEAPEAAQRLRGELTYFLEQHAEDSGAAPTRDEEVLERLRSLGYLHTSGNQTAIVERLVDEGLAPQDGVRDLNAMSAAKHLLFRGDYTRALGFTRKLITSDPDSPVYRELHVSALLGSGEIANAWEEGLALHAKGHLSAQLAAQLADRYQAAGHAGEAVRFLESYLDSNTKQPGIQWRLARIYREQGKQKPAIFLLEAVVEDRPGHVIARTDLATEYARAGNREAAHREFLEVTRQTPYHARGFYNFGVFLLGEGKETEASQAFHRVLEIEPEHGQARQALATISNLPSRAPEREARADD